MKAALSDILKFLKECQVETWNNLPDILIWSGITAILVPSFSIFMVAWQYYLLYFVFVGMKLLGKKIYPVVVAAIV